MLAVLALVICGADAQSKAASSGAAASAGTSGGKGLNSNNKQLINTVLANKELSAHLGEYLWCVMVKAEKGPI